MINKKDLQKQKLISKSNEQFDFEGDLYVKNKRRISTFKLFRTVSLYVFSLAIIFIIVFVIVKNSVSSAESITQDMVVSQLKKIISLPPEAPVNVMRVSDAKTLQSQDSFYQNVSNGDYILVYKNMAILYDFSDNFIKNIKTSN